MNVNFMIRRFSKSSASAYFMVFLCLYLWTLPSSAYGQESALMSKIRTLYDYPKYVVYLFPRAFPRRCFPETSKLLSRIGSEWGFRVEDIGGWYFVFVHFPSRYFDRTLKFYDEFYSLEEDAFVRSLRSHAKAGDDMASAADNLAYETASLDIGYMSLRAVHFSQQGAGGGLEFTASTHFEPSNIAEELQLPDLLSHTHQQIIKERIFHGRLSQQGSIFWKAGNEMRKGRAIILSEESLCEKAG